VLGKFECKLVRYFLMSPPKIIWVRIEQLQDRHR
jgi:hypothetical protein